MPWDAGLAILGVYRILRARKGRRLGGEPRHRDPRSMRVDDSPTIRRRSAEATPRSGILQKSIPKSRSNLEPLLEAKMLPKASQNDSQNLNKNHRNCDAVFDQVFDPILHRILLVSIVAQPPI